MAEIWAAAVAVVGIGVGAYESNQSRQAAKGAANAQTRASADANQTQLDMYNQSREDSLPWLNTGASALNKLATLYGLSTGAPAANTGMGNTGYEAATPANPGGSGNALASGNVGYEQGRPAQMMGQSNAAATQGQAPANDSRFADFYNSPDYQFALQQGTQNLDRSAAARGRLYSGGYGQDLVSYGQGMAAQQLGNYTNRLAAIAGVGQTASNNLNALGQNYANQYGNNLNNAAEARASSYAATANANNNLANGIGQAVNYYAQYNKNNQWGGV